MTTLDKELYRDAYRRHREWNEAELKARIRGADTLSPQQAWQQYLALWEFCMTLAPEASDLQRTRRLAEWDLYYTRIQKLEEWRRQRGSTT